MCTLFCQTVRTQSVTFLLAAMSSSSSDNVTQYVRPSVRPCPFWDYVFTSPVDPLCHYKPTLCPNTRVHVHVHLHVLDGR